MAKLGMVHCRICKKEIDRNKEVENVDWIMPSKNWFYHKECYDSWVEDRKGVNLTRPDEDYQGMIWEFLRRDLKIPVNDKKLVNQIHNFKEKKHYTFKGMYYSLVYFYTIQHGDVSKADGGIGIIPHVYNDALAYWQDQESKKKGIMQQYEEQLRRLAEQSKPIMKVGPQKKRKTYQNHFEEIEASQDE